MKKLWTFKTAQHSQKFLRQRKFFVLLPLFLFPFMTIMLLAFGLLGSIEVRAQINERKSGFNMNLPGPKPSKDSNWNKLNFYEQADKDAAKLASLVKSDPYYNLQMAGGSGSDADSSLLPVSTRFKTSNLGKTKFTLKENQNSYNPYPTGLIKTKDPNEEKVYRKLADLNVQLTKAEAINGNKDKYALTGYDKNALETPESTADIDRLNNMMQQMQGSTQSGDPQMQQINSMLEKILDIQHPDRMKDKLKEKSALHKEQVFPVKINQEENITLLGRPTVDTQKADTTLVQIEHQPEPANAFYSVEDQTATVEQTPNSIEAVIHETQTLVSGATVKLRLTNEVYINGLLIPKDQLVFGTTVMNGERLEIAIKSIRFGNSILPVALSVYDLDGMAGIYMPGSITRDVSKQATDQAIQGLGIASLDPSLGAQAASAGLTAAKSLLSKKAKLVKVSVKAGYLVLLRDDNAKGQ